MFLSLKTPAFLPYHTLNHPLNHPLKSPKIPNFICFNKGGNPNNNPNKISDADLASDFKAEVHKLNTQLEDTQVAMKKSKQLLFSDFCNHLDLNPDEFKNNWKNLSSDDKLGLVKGFVSDWGLNFHPLSPKSVRDLVEEFVVNDEHLQEKQSSNLSQKNDDNNANSVVFFPTLKKLIMGFSPDN